MIDIANSHLPFRWKPRYTWSCEALVAVLFAKLKEYNCIEREQLTETQTVNKTETMN